MAVNIPLAVVLSAAVATVALRAAARWQRARPVPGAESAPVAVTVGESWPRSAMTWPGRRTSRAGRPASLSRCSMYFTNCTPMGATLFARSAMASTG